MNRYRHLTKEQRQFSALLKAGLWGTPADVSAFDHQTDWMELLLMAKKQACIGVVYDGVLTLPAELQPPRSISLQWATIVAQIEEDNEFLNGKLAEVFTLYRDNGIYPILLKGQGVAQNYRIPLHRNSGDIDVYVGDADYEKANALLRKEASGGSEETNKHASIHWRGVTVENHRIMTHLNAPGSNQYFVDYLKGWYPNGSRTLNVGGYNVAVCPLEFDITFVLIHSVLHFLNEGVGLRQICDWTCMLSAQYENIDRKSLLDLFEGVGLMKAARAFGVIAVEFLGLPPAYLPFDLSEKDYLLGEWLLHDVLEGGNFGWYYKDMEKRPKGYWSGKWYTFNRAFRRCRELGRIAPAEARWYPLYLAYASAKAQLKLRLK